MSIIGEHWGIDLGQVGDEGGMLVLAQQNQTTFYLVANKEESDKWLQEMVDRNKKQSEEFFDKLNKGGAFKI